MYLDFDAGMKESKVMTYKCGPGDGQLDLNFFAFVICEDTNPENLRLKLELETEIQSFLFSNPFLNSEAAIATLSYGKDNVFKEKDVKGGVIIKPQITDQNGHSKYNISLVGMSDRGEKATMLKLLNVVLVKINGSGMNLKRTYLNITRVEYDENPQVNVSFILGAVAGGIVLFGLGVFIGIAMDEKEDKGFMLMRLNGVTFRGYYLTQWLYFCFLQLVPFLLGAAVMARSYAPLMSPAFFLAFVLLVLHTLQISSLGIILSLLFKRKMTAYGIVFYFCFQIYFSLIQLCFFLPTTWGLFAVPFLGSGLAIGHILSRLEQNFLTIISSRSAWVPLLMSFSWNIFAFFLGNYLFNVLKLGYQGALKPWHYIFTELFSKPSSPTNSNESVSGAILDEDVYKMYEKVCSDLKQVTQTHPLVLNHVTKVYKGEKIAVDDVTLALEGNQIFGLLGPNGAGKTTLLHIIAGLYSASSGNMILEGLDSKKDRRLFHEKIGFCPQHDIYWKKLTVAQHLRFFEILRGTKKAEMNANINETLNVVRLTQYANKAPTSISGGERRRLSLAMALSGNSRVMLLDEPTTGLDPKIRRLVWEIISEFRRDRLCILTTHSLEEAELLCDNLTIMAHGRLKCLGTPSHLKKKFGGHVFVTFENESGRFQDAVQGIRICCPDDTSVTVVSEGVKSLSGRLRFIGNKKQSLVLLRRILDRQTEFAIKNFGILQSSLEDVFMNVIRAVDADA